MEADAVLASSLPAGDRLERRPVLFSVMMGEAPGHQKLPPNAQHCPN